MKNKKTYLHQPETNPKIILANLRDACERAKLASEIVETLIDEEDVENLDARLKAHLDQHISPIRKGVFPVRVPKDDDDFRNKINVFTRKVNAQVGRTCIELTGLYNASSRAHAVLAKQWRSMPNDVLEAALPEGYLESFETSINEIKSEEIERYSILSGLHSHMRDKTAFVCRELFAQGIMAPQLRANFEKAINPDLVLDAKMATKIVMDHTPKITHKELEVADCQIAGVYALLLDYTRRKDATSLGYAHSMITDIVRNLDLRRAQFEAWLDMGADKPLVIEFDLP